MPHPNDASFGLLDRFLTRQKWFCCVIVNAIELSKGTSMHGTWMCSYPLSICTTTLQGCNLKVET